MIARWFLLEQTARPRNEAMEGVRGYAAWIVFLAHICGTFAGQRLGVDLADCAWGKASTTWLHFLHWGYRGDYGVEIFFILSGFLMFRMMRARASSFRIGTYLWQRALRIWPVFLVTLAITTWFVTQLWNVDTYDPRRLLETVTLLDGIGELRIQSYNPVSWSLSFELVFYFLCPLVLLWPKALASPLRFGCLVGALILLLFGLPPFYMRGSLFLFGGLLANCRDEQLQRFARTLPDWLVALLYFGATLPYMVAPPGAHWRLFSLVFAIAGTLLVVCGCFGDGWLHRFFRLRGLRLMGNISYSFYLIHPVCVRAVCRSAAGRSFEVASPQGSFALCLVLSFGLSLLAGALLYLLIERGYFVPRRPENPPWVRFYRHAILPISIALLLLLMGQVAFTEARDLQRGRCLLTCDGAHGFAGVVVSGDAQEMERHSELVMRSTGFDPMVLLPALPLVRGERIFVQLDLEVSDTTCMQLFYLTPGALGYSEAASLRCVFRQGRHQLFLRLPVSSIQGALRLDPMERPGTARLFSCAVWATPAP